MDSILNKGYEPYYKNDGEKAQAVLKFSNDFLLFSPYGDFQTDKPIPKILKYRNITDERILYELLGHFEYQVKKYSENFSGNLVIRLNDEGILKKQRLVKHAILEALQKKDHYFSNELVEILGLDFNELQSAAEEMNGEELTYKDSSTKSGADFTITKKGNAVNRYSQGYYLKDAPSPSSNVHFGDTYHAPVTIVEKNHGVVAGGNISGNTAIDNSRNKPDQSANILNRKMLFWTIVGVVLTSVLTIYFGCNK